MLALAVPADARGKFKTKTARFKATVSAEQATNWTIDASAPGCGGGTVFTKGSGSQSFNFRTKRAVTVKAMRIRDTKRGSDDLFLTIGRAADKIKVNGTVRRNGSLSYSGDDKPCAGGGSDVEPPAPPPPDCGTKGIFGAGLLMLYLTPKEYSGEPVPLVPVISLKGPSDPSPDELFKNCPGAGPQGLLLTPTGALPPRRLFGKRDRFSVTAKDREVTDSGGVHAETTMRWTMKFERLKGKRKGKKRR